MDYRNIFAAGFLILCAAVFVHSLRAANAFPQGPSASYGSNPVFSFSSTACATGDTATTVPSDQILVITDIILGGTDGEAVQLKTGSGTLLGYFNSVNAWSQGNFNHFFVDRVYSLRSGIVVPAGEDLVLYCENNHLTVSGYYAQP